MDVSLIYHSGNKITSIGSLTSFSICVSLNTNIISSDNSRFSLAFSSLSLLNFDIQWRCLLAATRVWQRNETFRAPSLNVATKTLMPAAAPWIKNVWAPTHGRLVNSPLWSQLWRSTKLIVEILNKWRIREAVPINLGHLPYSLWH